MYYVYILRGKNGKIYIGLTRDLVKRVKVHNTGKVKSTKKLRPLKVIYYEAFETSKLARREELFLKSGKL